MNRYFPVLVPVGAVSLLLCEIVLILFSFVMATCIVLPADPGVFLFEFGGLVRILPVLGMILAAMYFQDLYSRVFVQSRIGLLQKLFVVMGTAFVTEAAVSYLDPDLGVPLRVMLLGSALVLTSLLVWRILYSTYVLRLVGAERLLFVGNSALLPEMESRIRRFPEMGLSVVGYVEEADAHPPGERAAKTLGALEALVRIVNAVKPDRIVVGLTERRSRMPVGDLLGLRFAGFQIEEAEAAFESMSGRVWLPSVRPAEFILSSGSPPYARNPLAQRFFNLCLAVALALPATVLGLVIASLLRLFTVGPVLSREICVGRGGKKFQMLRFRTQGTQGGPSRFGHWLARHGFDAIPQFWNVLRGQMAVVGPTPVAADLEAVLTSSLPYYSQRHRLQPGMTGWAQIYSQSASDFEHAAEAFEYDLYYLRNMSLRLDIHIVITTAKQLLLRLI